MPNTLVIKVTENGRKGDDAVTMEHIEHMSPLSSKKKTCFYSTVRGGYVLHHLHRHS